MSTLPSVSSKRTFCGDRETIQLTPKDWISIDSKINCQLKLCKLFCLQSRFSLFTLIIDCHSLSACGWAWTSARCWHVILWWPTPLIGWGLLVNKIMVWHFYTWGILSYHTWAVWSGDLFTPHQRGKLQKTKRFDLTSKITNPWEVNSCLTPFVLPVERTMQTILFTVMG